MKKIINGKKYDTETAELLKDTSQDHPDYNPEDFDYWGEFYVESLYRKRTGEFFLYGRGGFRSKYARKSCYGCISGERIIPISIEEAKKWGEENLSGDEYESIFGEVEE